MPSRLSFYLGELGIILDYCIDLLRSYFLFIKIQDLYYFVKLTIDYIYWLVAHFAIAG